MYRFSSKTPENGQEWGKFGMFERNEVMTPRNEVAPPGSVAYAVHLIRICYAIVTSTRTRARTAQFSAVLRMYSQPIRARIAPKW